MKNTKTKDRTVAVWMSAIALGALVCLEIIIMISPFAWYFYSFFRPFLNVFSQWGGTAWLDGFFLNHALVSTSKVLNWQREIGRYLFAFGVWAFLISFAEVYGRKILRRGVARFGLYALVRHPQYASLAVAGWGLLTIWPRFFLLVVYVTMVFIYFLLAANEERRMEALYPESYPAYAKRKGSFVPGSPGDWLYQRTFGKIPNRTLGFVGCYVSVLVLAVLGGFLARSHLQTSAEMVARSEAGVYGFSCWPQGEEQLSRVMDRVLADEAVRQRMMESKEHVFFLHVLPDGYQMKGMFYTSARTPLRSLDTLGALRDTMQKAGRYLRLRSPFQKGPLGVGYPSDQLTVVVSGASQPWRDAVPFEKALRPGTKMVPIAVAWLDASKEGGTLQVFVPIPENRWGNVTMPIF